MKPVLAIRHVPHESLGTIRHALDRAGLNVHYLDVARELPAAFDPRAWSGLVVMGGPMNVDETDRYPFLAAEVGWLRDAVAASLPTLGVCLGSQLLAKAHGARVYANGVKEIGWYDVELLPAAADDPLLAGLAPRERVFQWHGDTFDLPAGAVQLARSPQCERQAFRIGRCAWGLQFHLEVDAAIVESWLTEPGNCGELRALPYIDPAAIRRDTPAKLPALQRLAATVFGRFAALCRGQATRG
jgi:GMP synthase (glutamine-hydrolysing)